MHLLVLLNSFTMRLLLTSLSIFLIPFFSLAQTNNYPQDYFRNPLDIPIFLAGNFGECRPGHFHSGIDIKTQGKENLQVHAAAAGYISRIKTEKGGFGHAIYITHPNGYTTLYAHLNHFEPKLQKYLRTQQYKNQKWDLDLQIAPSQFPVTKGQVIAFSGNTGASSAPHLHFEIRDTKTEHPLNPQQFGLHIVDNISPVMREVVLYNGDIFNRSLVSYSLIKQGSNYLISKSNVSGYTVDNDTVDAPGSVLGIGISADDYMNGSDNTITFLQATLRVNDSIQTVIKLDDIGYDVSRYMHAYSDYYAHNKYHKWIQLLFRQPGNRLYSIYTNLKNDGRIKLDAAPVKVNIELVDNNGNKSALQFYIRPPEFKTSDAMIAAGCTPYISTKKNAFLSDEVTFSLDDRQLYDDFCFTYNTEDALSGISKKCVLGSPDIPIHHYFDLKIKPEVAVPAHLTGKVVLCYTDGKDEEGDAAKLSDDGYYYASTRSLGTYWLDIDTTAPTISANYKQGAVLSRASRISLKAWDNKTSVRKYEGRIDGQWVCFEQHGKDFFYEFDEHCARGKHVLMFTAYDENGNEQEYKLNFTR